MPDFFPFHLLSNTIWSVMKPNNISLSCQEFYDFQIQVYAALNTLTCDFPKDFLTPITGKCFLPWGLSDKILGGLDTVTSGSQVTCVSGLGWTAQVYMFLMRTNKTSDNSAKFSTLLSLYDTRSPDAKEIILENSVFWIPPINHLNMITGICSVNRCISLGSRNLVHVTWSQDWKIKICVAIIQIPHSEVCYVPVIIM